MVSGKSGGDGGYADFFDHSVLLEEKDVKGLDADWYGCLVLGVCRNISSSRKLCALWGTGVR